MQVGESYLMHFTSKIRLYPWTLREAEIQLIEFEFCLCCWHCIGIWHIKAISNWIPDPKWRLIVVILRHCLGSRIQFGMAYIHNARRQCRSGDNARENYYKTLQENVARVWFSGVPPCPPAYPTASELSLPIFKDSLADDIHIEVVVCCHCDWYHRCRDTKEN